MVGNPGPADSRPPASPAGDRTALGPADSRPPASPAGDRTAVPSGFRPLPPHDAAIYNNLVGPFWVRPEGETVAFGFRVELRHCNPIRLCHGGMLAGFADIVLTGGCNHVARLSRFLTTVSLTTDFLAPAPMGAWVEARPEVLTVTRSTLFGQCLTTADGVPVLRASGSFRFGGDPDPHFDRLRRLLEGQ